MDRSSNAVSELCSLLHIIDRLKQSEKTKMAPFSEAENVVCMKLCSFIIVCGIQNWFRTKGGCSWKCLQRHR
jgi:hypothetical protein